MGNSGCCGGNKQQNQPQCCQPLPQGQPMPPPPGLALPPQVGLQQVGLPQPQPQPQFIAVPVPQPQPQVNACPPPPCPPQPQLAPMAFQVQLTPRYC